MNRRQIDDIEAERSDLGQPARGVGEGAVFAGFAALRALADERGLKRLSMGTSQDYRVAVEEGATIVRIGTRLYN